MKTIRRVSASTLNRQLGPWRTQTNGRIGQGLAEQIRQMILDGRLPVQAQLPPERELAAELGISRTTVAGIYSKLRETGFMESRQGSGSWTTVPKSVGPKLSATGVHAPIVDLSHAALSADESFMSEAVAHAVEEFPRYLAGHGYHVQGLPVLRSAVAQRFTKRGLPTSPEEVLITNGAQHGLNLALDMLVQPGGRVMVDHPTYPGALDAIRHRSARAVPVGFDGSVWNVDAMQQSVRHAAPQLMYVAPDCHNPTGLSMSQEDRRSVMSISERSALPLVIDETLSELVLDGSGMPPLASFGSGRRSMQITIGSASKIFWGGLRVGWIRAPSEIVSKLTSLRAVFDMASPVLDQLIVANLFEEIDTIIEARQTALRRSRRQLIHELDRHLPSWAPGPTSGGLNLWVDIGAPLGVPLSQAAARVGIQLTPGVRFGVDGAFEKFVRMPFTLEASHAAEAVKRLAGVWTDVRGGGFRPYSPTTAV